MKNKTTMPECSVRSDSVTQWTVAHSSLSMRCSRQEYWSGLPFPTSGEPQWDNTIHSSEKFKSFFEKEENSTKKKKKKSWRATRMGCKMA